MKMKILIIDDEENFARELGDSLRKVGHIIRIYTKRGPGKMTVKESKRHFSEFGPQVTFCDIRWDKLDDSGWEFAADHADLPAEVKSRLIMMANVTEEFGNQHFVLKAHTFEAEFVTRTKLIKDPLAVIASTPGPKVMVIDGEPGFGMALTNEFREAGCVSIYCDPKDLIEDDVLRQISQFVPGLIVCGTNWTEQCHGEGLSLMSRLAGQYKFILTSGDPQDAQSLIQAAAQHGGYFVDQTAGAKFIVEHGKRLIEQGQLDQTELNDFRSRQKKRRQ